MNRFLILFCLFTWGIGPISLTGEEPAPPVCPIDGEWEFVSDFSDEFNASALDTEKWWDFNPEWVGRRPGLFARENVTVSDGFLKLTASPMPERFQTVENRVRGFHTFATAAVKSKKRIRYGYFEARCRAMSSGCSCAFWLYDPLDPPEKHKPGSYSEEIDIFEVFGKHPTLERTYFMTTHRQETPYVEATVRIHNQVVGSKWIAPHNFRDEFHTFGLLWTEEKMVWYLDGIERWSTPNQNHQTALTINFDSEIMKEWAGEPDIADLPSIFDIDWIRVWQKKE